MEVLTKEKNKAKEAGIVLVPYSRTSSPEFVNEQKRGTTAWNDSGGWSDGGWKDSREPSWHDGGGWHDGGWHDARYRASGSSANEAVLHDLIKVRRDGFVKNMRTEAVFYADAKTLSLLDSIANLAVSEVAGKHPDIAMALDL